MRKRKKTVKRKIEKNSINFRLSGVALLLILGIRDKIKEEKDFSDNLKTAEGSVEKEIKDVDKYL